MRLAAAVILLASARAAAATCAFTGVVGVSFGAYNPFDGAPLDSTGQLTIHCLGTATVMVDLGKGRAPSFAPRLLAGAADNLQYQLYLDAARTVVWGDGTAGTTAYGPAAVTDGDLVLPLYGRIPARQNVTAGAYADSITVTVDF